MPDKQDTKRKSFTMRVKEDFRPKLKELRRADPDVPGYTEMVEKLVDRAYEALQKGRKQ